MLKNIIKKNMHRCCDCEHMETAYCSFLCLCGWLSFCWSKEFSRFLFGGGFGEYPVGYFWFMNALIAVYLIYPLIKIAFDSNDKSAMGCLLAVIFCFSVGKDTVRVILQMLGSVSHHDFASVLDGVGQFYIFGDYGYVLMYFVIGGLIGASVSRAGGHCLDRFRLQPTVALLAVLLCYIVTFAIQRYQHAVQGTNLTVDHGYWLFPTFLATILVLQLLVNVKMEGGVAAVSKVVGANTFGIYMLHMIGLVLMSRLQVLPVFSCLGNMNSILVTLMNIVMALFVFLGCLIVSVLLRRIPVVGRLFSL